MKYSIGRIRSFLSGSPRDLEPLELEAGVVVKAIIGLGNPGQQYAKTRHNIGFLIVDELVERLNPTTARERFKSRIWEARLGDDRIILAQPQTFMNLSGSAVQQLRNWYKTPVEHLLVVYDDVDLEFGTLRMRERGSAGGHNGVASIIQSLGTPEIPRLRVGVGRGRSATRSHVLSAFSQDERDRLEDVVSRAAAGALTWLEEGPIVAMNAINQREHVAATPDAHEPVPPGAPSTSTKEH